MKYTCLARLKTEGEPYYEDPADDPTVTELFAPIRATERYAFGFVDWRSIWGTYETTGSGLLTAPHVWIPKPLPLIAGAVAAAIVKNPVITRRFWQGWGRGWGK